MLNVFKNILLFIMCFLVSIFLCMNIFDDVLIRFTLSPVAYMVMRLFLALFIYMIIIFFLNKKIKNHQITILMIMYVCFVLSLSFFKGFYNRDLISSINLNPLSILSDLKNADNTILLLTGNILAYVPIGLYAKYRFKTTKNHLLLLIFLCCSILIETTQYIFKLGVFDINDIILNVVGFSIGIILINLLHKNLLIEKNV